MKILDHATQGFNVCSSCHAAKLIQVVLNESTAHSFGDKNMFLIIDIKNAK
jgi:hypothetical protein